MEKIKYINSKYIYVKNSKKIRKKICWRCFVRFCLDFAKLRGYYFADFRIFEKNIPKNKVAIINNNIGF